jgi:tRNA-Thr(GGU) m(6)t(6)A37 methyltransferase TsaA
MELIPIGVIHSPYKERGDAPHQGRLSENEITLEILPQFVDGLKDIGRVSHLIVLYWGDRARRDVLQSPTPFSETPVGVFASRSPNRPNPIAFCVADLLRQEGNRLIVRGVDALDGSPLLDIKAYTAALDSIPQATNTNTQTPPHNLFCGRSEEARRKLRLSRL